MLGIAVDLVPSEVDESAAAEGMEPLAGVVAIAEAKAAAVAARLGTGRPVLAADTIVIHNGEVLGKPTDRAHATELLRRQSGDVIEVVSAVSLITASASDTRLSRSCLRIHRLDEARIEQYVATGAGDDKAGALEVQGAAKEFVTLLEGTRSNVYGLPLAETIELLRNAGIAVKEPNDRTL